jgi:hypothetical protein
VMDAMGHEKIDTTRLYNHPGTLSLSLLPVFDTRHLCSAKTSDGLKVHESQCKWRQLFLCTSTKETRRVHQAVRS